MHAMISLSLVFTGINLLGAAQGLFLSLMLALLKRGNRQANRILAALVFVISVALASTLLLPVAIKADALDVAISADADDGLFFRNQILFAELTGLAGDDLGATFVAELIAEGANLFLQNSD